MIQSSFNDPGLGKKKKEKKKEFDRYGSRNLCPAGDQGEGEGGGASSPVLAARKRKKEPVTPEAYKRADERRGRAGSGRSNL